MSTTAAGGAGAEAAAVDAAPARAVGAERAKELASQARMAEGVEQKLDEGRAGAVRRRLASCVRCPVCWLACSCPELCGGDSFVKQTVDDDGPNI